MGDTAWKDREEIVVKLYDQIKQYQKHEDILILARLNSLIVVSSFLFAAIALCTANAKSLFAFKILNIWIFSLSAYFPMMLMFGAAGAICAWYCIHGVIAARSAISLLKDRWSQVRVSFADTASSKLLPQIVDGGLDDNGPRPANRGTPDVSKTYVWRLLSFTRLFPNIGGEVSDSNSFGIAGTLCLFWFGLFCLSAFGVAIELLFGAEYFLPPVGVFGIGDAV